MNTRSPLCSSLRPACLAAALLLAAGALGGATRHASAQGTAKEAAGPDVEAAPTTSPQADKPTGAPFMKPLGRLSSILGSLHFLRTLCGDAKADVWRTSMDALITAQAPTDADRRVLVASFNGGYRAFESTYRQCTPAARLAVARYQDEGATLAREIGARYGN